LPWLHTLRVPTLILAGRRDPLDPVVNARLMACLIPDAEVHVVAGGGHLFLLDQPDDVVPVLTTFLDRPPRRSSPCH